ncbi:hypothetical protein Tco_1344338 [Tanacetum coccineum]
MRMEQYLTHTDYALWEVIVNNDALAVASASAEGHIPPKTAEQKLARKNELKAKSTLLLAIPDEHLLKFNGIKDAKTLWEAIKTRFGGNKESKKMQKTILKQQYENFTTSRYEGLDKTYDSGTNEAVNTALDIPAASPQLDNEDLEQIDTGDLEEMDLKGKCHFARECRAPRNQGNRNGDAPRRIVPVETPANALVVQDGIGGYDWSYQAEEGPTDFALMAHLSSGSSSSSSSNTEVQNCSKDCLKSYETLQKQYDQQRDALKKSNLEIIGYQLGLESLEARIVVHQKNEAVYEEDIAFLKYDVKVRDNSIIELKNQLAEALREKDDLKLKLKSEVFESASDGSVNEIEEENNQVNYRFKKVEGYHAVPPPYTGNYMPSRPDLSFVGLDDSVYKTNVCETITSVPRNESTASKSSKDRSLINGIMTQKLGDGFEFDKKACFVCGSLNHLIKDCNFDDNKMVGKPVLNNVRRVLTKSGNVPVNTANQRLLKSIISNSTASYVNTIIYTNVNGAKPSSNVFHKSHSPVKRTFNQRTTPKNSDLKEKVYTAKVNNVTTAGPKAVVSVVQGHEAHAVKASAGWIWRPKPNIFR